MDGQDTLQNGEASVSTQDPSQEQTPATSDVGHQGTSEKQQAQPTPSPYGGGRLYGGGQNQPQQAQPQQPQQLQQPPQQAQGQQGGIPEHYMQQPSQINIPAVLGYIHEQQGNTDGRVRELQETLKAM